MSEASKPLLPTKDYAAASVFRPENLLREARRQKGLQSRNVPDICILDPEGHIQRQLQEHGRAQRLPAWPACVLFCGPEEAPRVAKATGSAVIHPSWRGGVRQKDCITFQ